MAIRLSGMASGLDTDSMIQELVAAYSKKKDKYVKQQTKTAWTMDAWKEVNTKVYGFYTNTLSSMRYSSSYTLKKATISNSNVAQVSASTNAVTSAQTLAVKQLAASGYLTGGKVTADSGAKVTNSTKLSELGITEGTINVGDKEIELSGDMSIASLTAQFKGGDIAANFDENTGRFFLSAKSSGLDSEFTVTAGDGNGLAALQKLGLFSVTDVNGEETAEMKRYRELAGGSYNSSGEVDTRYDAAKWTTDSFKASIQSKVDAANKSIENLEKANKTAQEKLDKLTGADYNWEDDYKTVDEYNKAIEDLNKTISENTAKIAEENAVITDNQKYLDNSDVLQAEVDRLNADILAGIEGDLNNEIAIARSIVDQVDAGTLGNSTDSARINAKDSIIKLNGATFTSNTNSFSINGLSINATATTVTTSVDENGNVVENDNAVIINTTNDTQAIYDKIVSMFKGYNEMIAYMDGLYNAESADGYEPLTDEEMEAMTEKQIEDWEEKVKDALLRKDSTLGSISSALKSSILGTSVKIDGVEYSLATFGIATGSYFTTSAQDRGLFHIDGDKDDASVSGNEDKLMAMISKDPDATIQFFQTLATNLYDTLSKKMASSSLSSAFTIYNDKQMSSQYSDYKSKVEDWEERIKDYEDTYAKKFAAMEKALSKLQSQSNSLAGLLGGA